MSTTNNKINLISAEELIGEFLLDFDIQVTNYIPSLNRHIVRGIELMDIDTYFRRCSAKITIEENRGVLPCGMKYIEAIFFADNGYPYLADIGYNDLTLVAEMPSHIKRYSDVYVEEGYITFNNFEGEVFVVYKGLPINGKGYVLFPDDAWLKEALYYFIIYKMSLSGFKHKIISREEAYQQWNMLYPRARNSVNFPSVQEMQSFTEMWNNPLIGDWYNRLFS